MEPEAGKWLEICLLGKRASESLHWQFDYWQFDPAENWTALYPDQSLLWYLWLTIAPQRKSASVIPNGLYPQKLDLWQSQLLRLPNCGYLWRARTSDCSQCAATYRQYKYNDDLSERLPVIDDTGIMTTWVKSCQLSTIRV